MAIQLQKTWQVSHLVTPQIILPGVTKLIARRSLTHAAGSHFDQKKPTRRMISSDRSPLLTGAIACLTEVDSNNCEKTTKSVVRFTGLRRVRIVDQVQTGVFLVESATDEVQPEKDLRCQRMSIIEQLRSLDNRLDHRLLISAIETEIPLGRLCDLIAGSLHLKRVQQMAVLDELNIGRRCGIIRDLLKELQWVEALRPKDGMPMFSAN